MNRKSLLKNVSVFVLLLLSFIFVFSLIYIKRNFVLIGTNPFARILFHFIVQIDGTNPEIIKGIALRCFVLPLCLALVSMFFLLSELNFIRKIRQNAFFRFIERHMMSISAALFLFSFLLFAVQLKVPDYLKEYTSTSSLYEDDYVDPAKVAYEFPETKRNLIYILLESAETSDYSKAEGGALEYDCIPELYRIAEENITFNDNRGFTVAPGASWTIAAMIAQSSGIPLNIPIGENDFVTSNKFMPGAFSLGEILEQGGYHNQLLIGSEAVFSGRKYYYEMHGNYTIHDYTYYLENDLFSIDDVEWWGITDRYLFDFAKEDLTELAEKSEPFNLTLLTVDTHHPDGFICKDCPDLYPDQLANTFACSSRKVEEFLNWCKDQDFYDNTTIVIAGDHCSMSSTFDDLMKGEDRRVYFTIVNPCPSVSETEGRDFCTFDLYPTIVSSLGIEFEGNRLGLGTDLFSGEMTLCEKYGREYFFNQVKKHSAYYDSHILYGFDQYFV